MELIGGASTVSEAQQNHLEFGRKFLSKVTIPFGWPHFHSSRLILLTEALQMT